MNIKVNEIVTNAVKDVAKNGRKESDNVVRKQIKEFNNEGGDIAGRAKLLMDSTAEISLKELQELKKSLRNKMIQRNFSQNNIDYILSFTNKDSYIVAKELVNDEFAHSSDICWAMGYTTKRNAHLMADAARKKNYKAFYDIESRKITDPSQIEDLSEKVTKDGRKYIPKKSNALTVSKETLELEKNNILKLTKNKGADKKSIDYINSFLNEETIEVAKVLAEDKNASIEFTEWVVGYTNAENAEHMLRAILNKDYRAVYGIQDGTIREFSTLDARYAIQNRLKNKKFDSEYAKSTVETKLFGFANDDVSAATSILFQDPSFDIDLILKIAPKINKGNVNEFSEALLNKDFEMLEKLCGEKFNSREIDIFKETVGSKLDNENTDFVSQMEVKLSKSGFDKTLLNDTEVSALAKLLGTSEGQIKNMDKKEYRRLCVKHHPDRNPNNAELSSSLFKILNKLYLS